MIKCKFLPKKAVFAGVFALALPLVSGCTIYDFFSDETTKRTSSEASATSIAPLSSEHENDFNGYYQATNLNDACSFHQLGQWNEDPYMPSTGNINILVIPVEFSDYPFANSTIEDIRTLTAGSAADTNYWESLGSFYEKSSYGKLKLAFTQTDKVNVGSVSSFVGNTAQDDYRFLPGLALRKAVSSYKRVNGNASTKAFDSDEDGCIDAAIMIYSAPNFQNDVRLENYSELLWAYCYADYGTSEEPSVDSPIGYRYFWASYDFFYQATGTPKIHSGVDAHTLIHEAGHLLGADDYYNAYRKADDTAEPSGSLMMMAYNVGDHDMFSKLSFGWVDPYVVTDSCTITLRPSAESGDCIVLASSWNGTAFDEYVLIDFYTPTSLNALDAATIYPEFVGRMTETSYRIPGIRVFHIDHRLAYGAGYDDEGVFMAEGYLTDAETRDFANFDKTIMYEGRMYYAAVAPAITNSKFYDSSIAKNKGYELIQLVQKGRVNTTKLGEASTSADLFQKGDSFSIGKYSAFFPNQNKFNNGDSLPFSFVVDDLGSDGAILTFTKA